MNKEPQKHEKLSVGIVKPICIALFGVLILLVFYLILKLAFSNGCDTESNIINTGLTIIALAVSVWAGLNISNAIERKELDDFRSKTEDFVHALEDQVAELQNQVNNVEEMAFDSFLRELLKTERDEGTRYFYAEFSKATNIGDTDYFVLAKIESLFNQIIELHNASEYQDDRIICKAKSAIKLTKKEKGRYILDEVNRTERENDLIVRYLRCREAEFYYYYGYATDNETKQFECFSKSIDIFFSVFGDMGIQLPDYRSNKNSGVPNLGVDKNLKLYSYAANTIGDASSMIIRIQAKLAADKKDSKQEAVVDGLKPGTVKKYATMALFYCRCAAEWISAVSYEEVFCAEMQYVETYYRNCGVAYERYEKVFCDQFEYHKTIIDMYLKAFYHSVKGTKLRPYRISAIYHVLLSYLNRYLEHRISKIKCANEIDSEKELVTEDDINYLKNMVYISEVAMADSPRSNIPVVMNGFAYIYVITLIRANCEVVKDVFGEGETEYLRKVRTSLDMLDAMNIEDKYKEMLRGEYYMLNEEIKSLPV